MIKYDARNWLGHLFDVEGTMVREIVGRVAACLAFGIVVVFFHKHGRPLGISPVAHTLFGFAMGLLLVFRTNAAYDRYWEGRRAWGAITNDTRNLGRVARTLLGDDPEVLNEVLGLAAAFPYTLMHRLREEPVTVPASIGLRPGEAAAVEASAHAPMAVALRISGAVARPAGGGFETHYLFLALDGCVQRLVDSLGVCERIHSTPLPFVYVMHLRRAIVVYCFSLPFVLADAYGWGAIVFTFFLAYMFFGIEEIGVEIEDPFGHDANDLPLDLFCDRAAAFLLGLRLETPAPAADGSAPAAAPPPPRLTPLPGAML